MSRLLSICTVLSMSFACSNGLRGTNAEPDDSAEPEDTEVEDTEPPADSDGDGTPDDEDCAPDDADVHPGATERCDGIDNDCDGALDPSTDADGDGITDCEDACPIQVSISAVNSAERGTVADPFLAIQDGIDASPDLGCRQVRVQRGTYRENIDFLGYDLDVASVNGPAATTIEGDGTGPVVTFASGESREAMLVGFTVTGGGGGQGGGFYLNGADPVIRGNIVVENALNAAPMQGGGFYLFDSNALITDNVVSDNVAGYGGVEDGNDGGALFLRGGSPVIEGNDLHDNLAGDGGAIWMARSDVLIHGNLIVDNAAHDTDPVKGGQGGGINLQIGTTDTMIANNVIAGNVASTHGGGVAIYEIAEEEGDPSVWNNVIAFNEVTGTEQGAGLVGWSRTHGIVYNNVFYKNRGVGVWLNGMTDFAFNVVYGSTGDAYIGVRGDLTGTDGNLAVDPQFVSVSDDGDQWNDDYAPKPGSPLKNAGDPNVDDRDGSRMDIGISGGPYGW